MCVQVTKTANRFEISSLLEKILLKQVRWCLTFVGPYITFPDSLTSLGIVLFVKIFVSRFIKKNNYGFSPSSAHCIFDLI